MTSDPLELELAETQERDRRVWDDCAPDYEDQVVHGHPDVLSYLGFEEDLLDRLLIYLIRDCGRAVRLHDVGCGSGRLHLRYGRHFVSKGEVRSDPWLAEGLSLVSGLDFSAGMLALAHQNLKWAGLESLLGSRLLFKQGSAFDMGSFSPEPLPVVVALCNTIGVMQGPPGAEKLFASLARAVEAGGIAMVSCYRREAVASFALGNYESTMDVSGQPRWLEPVLETGEDRILVPRNYKRAYHADPEITVDIRDRDGNHVEQGVILKRVPSLVEETIQSGHIRTTTDYESRWYSFAQVDAFIAEHWSKATTFHLEGRAVDALRGAPAQLAFLDRSGLLAAFLGRTLR